MSKELAKLHGKENRVFCKPGFLSHADLARYYNAADLHISASQMETLGNTVLESLACGTPVITPRAQGFVDTIKENVTGLLWEPDNLDDAVKKVLMLRDDKELRQRLAKGAVDSISELKCSTTVKDLVDWYLTADEIRRTKTTEFARLLTTSGLLLMMFVSDRIGLPIIAKILEKNNEEEEDDKTRTK